MTVQELIDELKKCPQDTQVYLGILDSHRQINRVDWFLLPHPQMQGRPEFPTVTRILIS